MHARRPDGLHSQVRVFVAAAGLRRHADLARGFDLLEIEPEGAIGNPTQDLVLLRRDGVSG